MKRIDTLKGVYVGLVFLRGSVLPVMQLKHDHVARLYGGLMNEQARMLKKERNCFMTPTSLSWWLDCPKPCVCVCVCDHSLLIQSVDLHWGVGKLVFCLTPCF